MNFNQFLTDSYLKTLLYWGIKLFGITTSVFYLFFAIVVLRQTRVMKKTVEVNDRGLLLLFAFIQLLLVVVLLFYSLLIL